MDFINKIFDKNTAHGRSIRTWLQVITGIVVFFAGLLTIPGVAELILANEFVTVSTFATVVAVVTYVQNKLEQLVKYVKSLDQ